MMRKITPILMMMLMLLSLNATICSADTSDIFYKDYNKTLSSYGSISESSAISKVDISGKETIIFETKFTFNSKPTKDTNYSFLLLMGNAATDSTGLNSIQCVVTDTGNLQAVGKTGNFTIASLTPTVTYTLQAIWNVSNNTWKGVLTNNTTNIVVGTLENLGSSKTDGLKITSIDKFSITAGSGDSYTIGYVRIYDGSLKIASTSIADKAEGVRTDGSIDLQFNYGLDAATIGNISVKDESGNSIPTQISLNGGDSKVVKIYFPAGLEYFSKYIVDVPREVKSVTGVKADAYQFSFTTEKPPENYSIKLYDQGNAPVLDGNVENQTFVVAKITCNNQSYSEKNANFVALIYDTNGLLLHSEKVTVNAPVGCENLVQSFSFDLTTNDLSTKKYMKLQFMENFDAVQIPTNTLQAGILISKGELDRAFSSDRTFYNIELDSDLVVPDISMEGATLVTKATSVNPEDSPLNITTFSHNTTGALYKFAFSSKNKVIQLNNIAFSSEDTIKIQLESTVKGELNVAILKPKEFGGDIAYTIDEFKANPSQVIVQDVITANSGISNIEYTFPQGAKSGMYRICISGSGVDSKNIISSTIYYASQEDLDHSMESIKNILENSPANEMSGKIDAFILANCRILKLETEDYIKLTDKSIIFYDIQKNHFTNPEELKNIYLNALAVCVFNEAVNKHTAIEKYATIFGVSLAGDYESIANKSALDGILNTEKCATVADVLETFLEAIAITLVNQADPSSILQTIETHIVQLKIDSNLFNQYHNLNDKAKIINAMKGKDFSSGEAFRLAFKNAVEASQESGVILPPSTPSPSKNSPSSNPVKVTGVNLNTNVAQNQQDNAPRTADAFTDLNDVIWAKEAISNLVEKNIFNGKSEKLFAPNDNITREEFIKILVLTLNIEYKEESGIFSDAPIGQWYTVYVDAAYKKGLTKGIGGNMFGIGSYITREDMAVMIYNALKATGIELSIKRDFIDFEDSASVSDYAFESVKQLYQSEIINGVGSNHFAPKDYSIRAMAAQMLNNLLKNMK